MHDRVSRSEKSSHERRSEQDDKRRAPAPIVHALRVPVESVKPNGLTFSPCPQSRGFILAASGSFYFPFLFSYPVQKNLRLRFYHVNGIEPNRTHLAARNPEIRNLTI
jgi:hypothetical protein